MAWIYIKEGAFTNEELGPFDDQQITALVARGTIKKKTAIQHPEHTGGNWVDAFDAGPLRRVFTKLDEAATEKKRQEDEKKAADRASANQRKSEERRLANEQIMQQAVARRQADNEKSMRDDAAGKLPVAAAMFIGVVFCALLLFISVGVPMMIFLLSQAKSAPQEASIAAMSCALFVAAYCVARSVEKIARATVRR